MIKKSLLVILNLGLSVFAMEEGLDNRSQTPIKFQFNEVTGELEDAPNHYLIQEFKQAVGDVVAGYGMFIDTHQQKLNTLIQKMEDTKPGSPENFGYTLHRRFLEGKIKKYHNKAADLVAQEKKITELYQAFSTAKKSFLFSSVSVDNYPFFRKEYGQDNDPIPPITYGLYNIKQVSLTTKYILPTGKFSYFFIDGYLGNDRNLASKIVQCHKQIEHLSEIMCLISMECVPDMGFALRASFDTLVKIAEERKQPLLTILKEEIDSLANKIRNIYIPQMYPRFLLFQIIDALQNQVAFEREATVL